MSSVTAAPGPRFAVPERLEAEGFAGFDAGAEVTDFAGATMGTRWSVRAALPIAIDPGAVEAAIRTRLDRLVTEMSHWNDTSLLSRFNSAASGTWTDLPTDFAAVVSAALEVAELSGGAFDPALGRLTDCWGLGPRAALSHPTAVEVDAARKLSGWRRLAFDHEAARLRQPGGVWLDLSGIAKGYAADAVADSLAGMGILHMLVEVGGECVGRGMRPDGDPWWVELETPPNLALQPIRVALHQLAVATSGNYLRGAHAIDPATGGVVLDGPIAVSVIHPSCMLADAWASAFAVLPEGEGQDLAERGDLAVRAVTCDGREWLSTALGRMLD